MQVQTFTQNAVQPHFYGFSRSFKNLGNTLSKLLEPKEIVTAQNQKNINRVTEIAKNFYNPTSPEPVSLTVKNGSRDFEFLFNNSAWHKVRISKKGEEVHEFEIMHVKNNNDFAFYSTGDYPCKIIDEKYISKFNELLDNWLPRLIKKYEKQQNKMSF